MAFIPFLQTVPPGAASGSLLMTVLPFGLIILIFYFFIIRPQNKKQKETEKMIAALKKGDKVVTIGGIHGVVSSTKEQTVIVKVDDGAKIEFNRTAIASVVTDKTDKVEPSKADKKTAKKDESVPAETAETETSDSSAEENK